MKGFIVKFLRDEEGVTIVEYAAAAGVMIASTMVAFMALGTSVSGMFSAITVDMNSMAANL